MAELDYFGENFRFYFENPKNRQKSEKWQKSSFIQENGFQSLPDVIITIFVKCDMSRRKLKKNFIQISSGISTL